MGDYKVYQSGLVVVTDNKTSKIKVHQSGLVVVTDNKTSKIKVHQSGLIIVQKIKRFVVSGEAAIVTEPFISPSPGDAVLSGDATVSTEAGVAMMDPVDGSAEIVSTPHAGLYLEDPICGSAELLFTPHIEVDGPVDGGASILTLPKVFGRQEVSARNSLLEGDGLSGLNAMLSSDGITEKVTISGSAYDSISAKISIDVGDRAYDSLSTLTGLDGKRDEISTIVSMSSRTKDSLSEFLVIGDTKRYDSVSGINRIEDTTTMRSSLSVLLDFKEEGEPVSVVSGSGDDTTSPDITDIDDPVVHGTVTAGGQTVIINPDGTCTGDCTAGQLDPETGEWITPIQWIDPLPAGTSIDITYVSDVILHFTTYKIFLDDTDITSQVLSANIGLSQGNVHNDVTLNSMNSDLFWLADETEKTSEARIRVEITTGISKTKKSFNFLLEKKSISDDVHFSLWGRSLSALDDELSDDISVYLDEPMSAKDLCESHLTNSLTWDIPDWILPAGFGFNGKPLGLVKALAEKFKGGVAVRGGKDGTITIRRKQKDRPITLSKQAVAPDIEFSRRNILQPGMSSERIAGDRYTAVEVMGYGSGLDLPEIDLENQPKKGEQAVLRCFWAGRWPLPDTFHNYNEADLYSGEVSIGPPYSPFATYSTAGVITAGELFMNVFGRTLVEEDDSSRYEYQRLEFVDGKATVDKPITDVLHFQWIGKPGPDNYRSWQSGPVPASQTEGVAGVDFDFTQYDKEIRLLKEKWAIAEVAWTSTYQKYYVDDHYVDALIAVFILSDVLGVAATVKMSDASKDTDAETPLLWGEGITDNDFTTDEIAVFAGTMYLDQVRYDQFRRSMVSAYSHDCEDGKLAMVSNDDLGLSGMCYIESADISFEGPKVTQNVQILRVET